MDVRGVLVKYRAELISATHRANYLAYLQCLRLIAAQINRRERLLIFSASLGQTATEISRSALQSDKERDTRSLFSYRHERTAEIKLIQN